MKTAGLVLDFYDDATGELLKKNFPTPDSLPDVVKTAHILTPEERDVLRDEAFALVLVNEGRQLRKFACVDAGNTLLSALYFLENQDRLPKEAQKVAAANIESACEEFGLPIRSIEKIAAGTPTAKNKGSMRTRDTMKQPIVGDDADWVQRTNLNSVRGGADAGRVIPTASQMKTAGVIDRAKSLLKKKDKGEKVNFLDSHHKLNPEAEPKEKAFSKVSNVVDVTSLEVAPIVKRASAERTALRGKYSLDSFEDVEKAVQYFTENYKLMDPSDRREFAEKTASRAQELTIQTTEILERYGSSEYAPDVDMHLASRRALAPEHNEVWNELAEKRASIDPSVFAELLGEADESVGLNWLYGNELSDNFFATFGGNKKKEANALWTWQSRTGDYVDGEKLSRLARNGKGLLMKQFSGDLVSAFMKDPITIFESLPDVQKVMLARLAASEYDAPSISN